MNKRMKHFCDKKLEDYTYCSEVTLKMITKTFTVLLGPNGTGKSTSIRFMEQNLSKLDDTCVVSYSTTEDDTVKKHSSPFDFRPEALAAAFFSEGERMQISFNTWVRDCLAPAIKNNKSNKLYIFIDEADSGLSYDKILESFVYLLQVIKKEVENGRKIYLIITANSYELSKIFYDLSRNDRDFIWVPTKEKIDLGKSYSRFIKRYYEYYKYMNFNEDGSDRE